MKEDEEIEQWIKGTNKGKLTESNEKGNTKFSIWYIEQAKSVDTFSRNRNDGKECMSESKKDPNETIEIKQ